MAIKWPSGTLRFHLQSDAWVYAIGYVGLVTTPFTLYTSPPQPSGKIKSFIQQLIQIDYLLKLNYVKSSKI